MRKDNFFNELIDKVTKTIKDIRFNDLKGNKSKFLKITLGSASIKELFEDGKNMISLVKDFRNGEYRDISWGTIGMIVFAFLYLVSPIDLIPDFIPILGLIDDVLIFRLALSFIRDDLDRYVDWKRNSHIEEAQVEEVLSED